MPQLTMGSGHLRAAWAAKDYKALAKSFGVTSMLIILTQVSQVNMRKKVDFLQ